MNSSKRYNNDLVKRANAAIKREKMIKKAHNRTIAWRDQKIREDAVVNLRMAKLIAALIGKTGKVSLKLSDIENADEAAVIMVPVDDDTIELVCVDQKAKTEK